MKEKIFFKDTVHLAETLYLKKTNIVFFLEKKRGEDNKSQIFMYSRVHYIDMEAGEKHILARKYFPLKQWLKCTFA